MRNTDQQDLIVEQRERRYRIERPLTLTDTQQPVACLITVLNKRVSEIHYMACNADEHLYNHNHVQAVHSLSGLDTKLAEIQGLYTAIKALNQVQAK